MQRIGKTDFALGFIVQSSMNDFHAMLHLLSIKPRGGWGDEGAFRGNLPHKICLVVKGLGYKPEGRGFETR
jgi:hypothetical protein